MNDPTRPSPEALLRAAQREARGRLKVFLGAAPGVGKTYEMLSSGKERMRAGVDVVIGLIETHGRAETEEMVQGYEIIARRKVEVQGRILDEMDLDAIFERHPQLVLVDELAHTNVPGSRHPKRYQDIAELLDAGIDVYTTVNIQHLESLNDVVASFSRVRVRETVPDKVLEDADLEVVDLPPDELIERLKAGKVYVPHEASRALQHFFSKSNLSALRELALRRAAQAADAETQEQILLSSQTPGAPAGERVIVAMSARDDAAYLVRAGKRLADALHAPWSALYIETVGDQGLAAQARNQLNAALQLAAQLGGETVSLPARTIAEGMITALKDARATHLIMGTRRPRTNWGFSQPRLVEYVARHNSAVTMHLVPNAPTIAAAAFIKPTLFGKTPWQHYAYALLMVVGVTLFSIAIAGLATLTNTALFYLIPVMASALLFGLRPGLFAGFVSALAYNFFFIPPIYTFTINDPQNLVTLSVFIGVAVVIAQLAHRVRIQADLAMVSARTNAALAGFARRLTSVTNRDTLAHNICDEVARLLDVQVIMVRRDVDGTHILASVPPSAPLNPIDTAAAQWVIDTGKPAGYGSDTLTASDYLFQPIGNEPATRLALGLGRNDGAQAIAADRVALLASLVDQSTLAFDRVLLSEEMVVFNRLEERDQLRAALLNSVSHDLRTPLTTILATTQALKVTQPSADVTTIEAEALRLNRFIANLLDMSRIEAGSISLALEPVDLIDAVATAVHDLRATLDEKRVKLDIPANLPLVRLDPHLFHHILINILENACKYGPEGTPILVAARRTLDGLMIDISDEGEGLPDDDLERVFEVFTRLSGSDRIGGTGLGLAIVKGFANAMGLSVSAQNRTDRNGATFRLIAPPQLLIALDQRAHIV